MEMEGQEREPLATSWPTPPGWRRLNASLDGASFRVPGGSVVIASAEVIDGERWAHLSRSHQSRLPTWSELVEMRDILLGPEVEAYQVVPPVGRYVNIHPRVLHLWSSLDRPAGVLPRFDGVVGGIRTI